MLFLESVGVGSTLEKGREVWEASNLGALREALAGKCCPSLIRGLKLYRKILRAERWR